MGKLDLNQTLRFFSILKNKKLYFIRAALFLIVSLLLFSSCWPKRRVGAVASSYTELKLGQLKPKDSGSGTTAGLSMGRRIDDRLWWGFEGGFFKSSFTKATVVPDTVFGNNVVSTKQVQLDYTTTMLSLFLNLSYELRLNPNNRFYYRASAGAGWEFIWNKEKNYVDNVFRTRTFNTPALQLTTGFGIGISRTSLIFGDIVYNMAKARSSSTTNEAGLPTYQEINMSGFGFRVGVNIWDIGFFRP